MVCARHAICHSGRMRFLFRLFVFWLVVAPLSYHFGLPLALQKLTDKARTEANSQCLATMHTQGMMGRAGAPLSQAQGEGYCRCVSQGLVFTKQDLWDAALRKPPAALNTLAKSLADSCNRTLEDSIATPL